MAAIQKIVHIDADCFFAALEIRQNPRLQGKPLAVGGDPEHRGVISTCSYEARRFGVHSAMAAKRAKQLCPGLIILKPNMPLYREASAQIMSILAEYSESIEPLSLDEAYLQVQHDSLCRGSGTLTAQHIQRRVHREVGIRVSAGVAPIKFLAKIASDWNKPNGLFVVVPEQVEPFTASLPVNRLPGVGPVTAGRLHRCGLYHCADIRHFGLARMVAHFGSFGTQMFERAWGRDERTVNVERTRKSLSVERTYSVDKQIHELAASVPALMTDLQGRYHNIGDQYRIQKVFVKLKFDDFRQTTLETALPVSRAWPAIDSYQRLLVTAWHRIKRPVRLVGIGLRLGEESHGARQPIQLPLFSL